MSFDPRIAIIEKRLSGIGRVIAVTGGKGGIGKSLVASTLALTLSRAGHRTGLLDLDFTGPCDHIILNIDTGFPEEKFGIVPPDAHGIRFMSITHFSGERPAPLRGQDMSSAIVELLSITQWGDLDFLVIDMPPGLGDAALDAIRLIPRAAYLMLTTPSQVVHQTVARTLNFMAALDVVMLGLVENMGRGDAQASQTLANMSDISFLGSLPFDASVESAIGNPDALSQTPFARALRALHPVLIG